MKKKISIISAILCVISSAGFIANSSLCTTSDDNLLKANIEALTDGEDISGRIDCSGSGGLYCPLNNKSIYKEIHIYQ